MQLSYGDNLHEKLKPIFWENYGKCLKNSNTKVSDKMTHANSADLDQTAPEEEQSDQGLHCLPFH